MHLKERIGESGCSIFKQSESISFGLRLLVGRDRLQWALSQSYEWVPRPSSVEGLGVSEISSFKVAEAWKSVALIRTGIRPVLLCTLAISMATAGV